MFIRTDAASAQRVHRFTRQNVGGAFRIRSGNEPARKAAGRPIVHHR